jgi:protein O-GlcNAc transferase
MFKNLLNRILSPSPSPSPSPGWVPDDVDGADALIAEGNAREDGGDAAQAEALYRRAVALAPGHARAHLNLGIVLAARDDLDGSMKAYEQVLAIAPADPFGNYNYARLALVRGDLARAETLVGEALRAKPGFPQALVVQANVMDALGRLDEAVASLQAALALQPDDAGAWYNLGLLLQRLARADEAEPAIRRALAADPGNTSSLELLARVLRDQGFVEQALEPLRDANARDPGNWALRSLELLLMNFADGIPADALFRRHQAFGADMERAVPARFPPPAARLSVPRRLRVGYLSGDLILHPVPFFLIPVLEHHDRALVEVFCYSFVQAEDGITRHLRQLSEHWRDAATMTDAQLADAIHADGIDVLVDLAGHTERARLGVFCQRPAPAQVAWLGYLNTTGLTRMDYRLCDARTDPLALSQPVHTERLVHLPESQWCYRPMVDTAIEPVAPFERNGFITFGSFNAALKISSRITRHWGEAMARLPGSRLVVCNAHGSNKRAAMLQDLEAAGVAADRVEFVPRIGLDKYLGLFNRVDISLDTFPYGGGTTTLDSLWMGVPVLAATGDTPVSRSAASVLQLLGMADWVAPGVDGFVDVAFARASDTVALAALRRELRPRMQASPLTDMPRFVRDLEAAYGRMRDAGSSGSHP